ncbi:MAG TPA: hypothetical protein VIN77_16060, partial [Aurantimonas sp.]
RSSAAAGGAPVSAGESQSDEQADRTSRRRGRPRRSREGEEAVAASAGSSRGDEGATAEARKVEDSPGAEPLTKAHESEAETPVKRRPGRPRKKKPEDASGETSDGEGNTLPDFLLASNG